MIAPYSGIVHAGASSLGLFFTLSLIRAPIVNVNFSSWQSRIIADIATGMYPSLTVNEGYMPVAMSAIMRDCHEEKFTFTIGALINDKVKKSPKEDAPACTMPEYGAIIDNVHRVMKSSDHLKFLCDWIQ